MRCADCKESRGTIRARTFDGYICLACVPADQRACAAIGVRYGIAYDVVAIKGRATPDVRR